MNIFGQVAKSYEDDGYCLGSPAKDGAHMQRRLDAMYKLNPNGFPLSPKELRVDAEGLSRGDKKRLIRGKTVLKQAEEIEASRAAFKEKVKQS